MLISVAEIARPYNQFQFSEMSWMNTNRVINTAAYFAYPPDKQKETVSNLGFALRIEYYLNLQQTFTDMPSQRDRKLSHFLLVGFYS